MTEFHGWTFLFGPTQRTLASVVTFLYHNFKNQSQVHKLPLGPVPLEELRKTSSDLKLYGWIRLKELFERRKVVGGGHVLIEAAMFWLANCMGHHDACGGAEA